MKIQPVQKYPEPGYPTRGEARENPELLKNLPARWEKAPGLAALLGVLALVSTRAEADGEGAPPAAALDPEAAVRPPETAAEIQKTGAVVAPILDEALARDGRGAFGCIVINPPSFLAEDEALELIRTELESAGLQLQDDAVLENMTAPTGPDMSQQVTTNEDGSICISSAWGKPPVLGQRPVRFDWADTNRAVYIEYLGQRDYREWEEASASSVDSYDFTKLAGRVAEAYGKYPADRRTVFGIFFDPMADEGVEQPQITGLSPEEGRVLKNETRQASAEAKDARGRDKLRRQVRHFIEFLKQEGLVPPQE